MTMKTNETNSSKESKSKGTPAACGAAAHGNVSMPDEEAKSDLLVGVGAIVPAPGETSTNTTTGSSTPMKKGKQEEEQPSISLECQQDCFCECRGECERNCLDSTPFPLPSQFPAAATTTDTEMFVSEIESLPSVWTATGRLVDEVRPGAYLQGGSVGGASVRLASVDPSVLGRASRLPARDMPLPQQQQQQQRALQMDRQMEPQVHDDYTHAHTHDPSLMTARAVTDEENQVMGIARPQPENQSTTSDEQQPKTVYSEAQSRAKLIAIVVLLACLPCAVITLAVWERKRQSQPNTTNTKLDTPSHTTGTSTKQTPQDYLGLSLPEATLLQAQQNSSSPQGQAFQWLAQDPALFNYTESRLKQRFALAAFYHATNGPTWTQNKDWLSYDIHECQWFSVGRTAMFGPELLTESPCHSLNVVLDNLTQPQANGTDTDTDTSMDLLDTESYKVMWLSRNNMTGSLPPEFYWLTSLQAVDWMNNEISGTFDANIGTFTHLYQLQFPSNQFEGEFPTEIGLLSNTLTILHASMNRFRGAVPTEIGLLQNLQQLALHLNSFDPSQTIPSEVGLCTNLFVLSLPNVTGTVPPSFANLVDMRYIYLNDNWLTGSIPTFFDHNIQWLLLNNNRFTGSVPAQLGQLSFLQELQVNNNYLTGSPPTELGLLANLYKMDVSGNQLSGSILLGTYIGLMTDLQSAHFSDNLFSSTIPTEVGRLLNLEELWLGHNAITGLLPSQLGLLTASLRVLNVSNNALSGEFPTELYSLFLGSNQTEWSVDMTGNPMLSGTLPDSLCDRILINNGTNFTWSFDCTDIFCGCQCDCPSL